MASKYGKILSSSSSEHRVFAAKLIMEALKELTATFRKESCLQETDENSKETVKSEKERN